MHINRVVLILNPRSSILLLRLGARNVYRLAPLDSFSLEKRRKLLGRIADELRALGRNAVRDFGNLDDAHHLGVQLVDDVARSSRRHRDAEPRAGLEAFEPLLVDRRNIGRDLYAFQARYAERTRAAGFNVRKRR